MSEQDLSLLQQIRKEVSEQIEAHFDYLENILKHNSNAKLLVNKQCKDRIPIHLGRYVSIYDPLSFIPTVGHKYDNVHSDITTTIGNTPLVRLNNIAKEQKLFGTVLLKLEFFNPLNSVKDRIGVQMFKDVFNRPNVNKSTTFIEPTSGNTGIGLAFVAAAQGLKLILVLPEHMSDERKKMFKLLGAQLVLTPRAGGMKAAIQKAQELNEKIPNSVILQQFENPSNPMIHRLTTAEEIWSDTNGQIDYLVSGVGTGGTITGIGEVIKSRKNNFKVVAVEPAGSPVLSGGKPGPHIIQGIGAGFIPQILNTKVYDEIIQVPDSESLKYMRKIISQEGIPVGVSSGAIVWAAIQLAKREETKGKIIVAIIPSQTERYLTINTFNDPFLVQSDEAEIQSQIDKIKQII